MFFRSTVHAIARPLLVLIRHRVDPKGYALFIYNILEDMLSVLRCLFRISVVFWLQLAGGYWSTDVPGSLSLSLAGSLRFR